MQVKHLSITVLSLLYSLLLPSLSQAQRVSIPDANLAAAIREEIGDSITRQTLLNLTRLEAPNRGITDLTGLEHARNLTVLDLGREYIEAEPWFVNSNAISDFSPIAGLTQLTQLNLTYCGLSDVSFLSGLTQLTGLGLSENSISDISALAKLTKLTSLNIWDNSILNISPLAELKKLTSLDLSSNSISDISALAELKQLNGLYLLYNSISDISPLAELKKLDGLQLDGNSISDISPLAELKKLTWLTLSDNSISDISPLAELTQLTRLRLNNNSISDVSPIVGLNLTGTEWDSTGLNISGNPLSYASINTHIPAMQARGIEIEFDTRVPTTLVKIAGTAQQGIVNTMLPAPFVVEVLDQEDRPFAGVLVTFSITAGSGRLSTRRTTTDVTGRATTHLTFRQAVGTTTVRVTAADVSQPVQFTATSVLRSAPVPIPDVNLHEKIATTLRKPSGETITFADMLKLRTLTANNAGILDLVGLQYASNLTSLTLKENSISDVSPLAGLTGLTTLELRNNWLSDVSPLAGLTRLTTLDLRNNWLSDVSPLVGLDNLQRLFLQGNSLSDTAIGTHIRQLRTAGAHVRFDSVSTHEVPIVRLIYFRPRDRQPPPDINAQMDRLIKDVQQAYAQQMESQGLQRKTFQFETDATGRAVVHHLQGKFKDEYYQNQSLKVWEEIDEQFDRSKNVYLAALDVSSETIGAYGGQWCGLGSGVTHSGEALIPASGGCFNIDVTAHELGHAFGLQHDFRSNAKAKRILRYTTDPMITSFCAAEWLDAHRAFNPNQITTNTQPTVEMLPPSLASRPNTIRLRFKVTDPDGVHQVQFLTPEVDFTGGLLACKRLNGATSRTVEFVTTELTPRNESVYLQVMDVNGNFTRSEAFPVDIASLLPPSRGVRISDPNLAAAIREEIGNAITTHTLLNLARLDVPNRGIKNLTGLEHAHNLKALNLGSEYIEGEWQWVNSNRVSNFSPLVGLTQLTSLRLDDSNLSDVSLLAKLTQLTDLYLGGNTISDISPLAKLTQLTNLNLYDNSVSGITPLAELTQLTDLYLGGNTISDISPLTELRELTNLDLYNNTISDITPLAGLTQLTNLTLWDNIISDISPLAKLTQLTYLDLGDNSISDISALAELTQLTDLRIGSNIVSDISALTELKKLIYLNLYGNIISDISPLAGLTQLTRLRLNNNSISDISPIVGLNLTGTQWDSTGLDIRGNPLNAAAINTHIPAMRAKGVVVVFEDSNVLTQGAGEKIVGPWLWVIAPTGNSGAGAAASDRDFLSEISDGAVTELEIATNGATVGTPVGDSVWTLHRLSATGEDNINDMATAAGLGTGNIDTHVAYGSIALDAPRKQQTQMFAGSDDAVKVWLNGELVHNNPVDRGATDFQDQFPVTLKKGTNILLVAVYEGWGDWTGFFGFAADA